MLFRRYGCHHCGTRFGSVIADHQPPNKTVYGSTVNAVAAAVAQRAAAEQPLVAGALNLAYPQVFSRLFGPTKVKQRFFPQCGNCSQSQADAMRRSVKKLVLHFGGAQTYAYAGVLVGLRQYSPPTARRGTSLESWFADHAAAAERSWAKAVGNK